MCCSQQTTTGPYSEENELTVGILKFILILRSSLYPSLQNSIVPSGFLPTPLCYSHFPIHYMSTSTKLLDFTVAFI